MTKTRQPPPDYGIIYNWDGGAHSYSEYPQSVDQLLDLVFAPLEDTQVGALFWCIGEDEARWPSAAMPMIGEAEERRYGLVRNMRRAEGIRAMFERGDDPYAAMVKRGHDMGIHVYCSIRMNDNHFWSDKARREPSLKPEDMAKTVRPGLSQLRKDHPEWVLGIGNAPRWAATSWNMAIPEVREMRLQHVTEACHLADWDGVELDWQRHAFHLPEDDAHRLRYTLTDLQRAVRRMTDRIAVERGSAFFVSVRVGASMETCRRAGYDIEGWVEEALCDIVGTNANSGIDTGVEIERFLALANGNAIKLYPGFDSHWEGGGGRLVPVREWMEAWHRGLAKGYRDRGASGVHIFNWPATATSRRSFLTTLGATETLDKTNKVYTPVKRFIRAKSELRYGAERDDRLLGELPVALYPTLTHDGPRFHVRVHDEVVAESNAGALDSVELHLELEGFSTTDEVEVTLDGEILGPPTLRDAAAEDPNDPADVGESKWAVWALRPEQADWGNHEVKVVLVGRDPRLRQSIVVQNVEVHVRYHE